MTTLVTGAGGFLGGALVARLAALGERDIRCFVRRGADAARLLELRQRFPQCRLAIVDGNLIRPEDCERAVDGARTIYHLAAAMRGAPADLFLNTVVATRNLFDAAARSRPERIVLVSSLSVYGTAQLHADDVVRETTPLEPFPERRDPYSYAKHRQDQLGREYADAHRLPVVIVRPGVIYGPRRVAPSTRVGVAVPGAFLHLGGDNPLPLSYVDNCCDALRAAACAGVAGEAYNAHDDDLPTCAAYLRAYRRAGHRLRVVRLPYPLVERLSGWNERYHAHSRGQLPAVLTVYRSRATWRPMRFDNAKIKSVGWRQAIPTPRALALALGTIGGEAAGAWPVGGA